MPAFSVTESSATLRLNRAELEGNWNRAMAELDEAARRRYLASLQQERDPARQLLFLFCLHCGAIQAEVYYRETVYFFMGIPVGGPDHERRHAHLAPIQFSQGELRFVMWVHRDSVEIANAVFRREILPLVRQLLLCDTRMPGRNWIDYLQILESFLSRRALRMVRRGWPITFSHFRFQNLNHYFGLLGEAGANEMIQHIGDSIRQRLKSRDLPIILSPHSYLVLSVGATEEQIYPRFQTLYFEIKSLILDYELLVRTIRTDDFSVFELFRELKI